MIIHDPRHVAQLAALILSSRPDPEKHHIKAAVAAAVTVLDEAFLRAEEDEAKQKQADPDAAIDPSMQSPSGAAEKSDSGDASKADGSTS